MLLFGLRYWKELGAVAIVMMLVGYHWRAVYVAKRDGYQNALKDVNAASERLNKAADEGTKTVTECFAKGEPWIWDRGMGKCVKE